MFSTILSILVGKLGLGFLISGACLAAWYFIPNVPWLTDKLRRLLLVVGVIVGTWTLGYGYGAVEGVTIYKAKIEAAIKKAVDKGDKARAKALKEFDESTEIPDDGFARD